MNNENDDENGKFYRNKLILGPMVRIGTLPMRLLALKYGADLVYTNEIIDYKLIKSKRYVNEELDAIDFIDDTGFVVFRTCSLEKGRVILQIGTNDPDRVVAAAKIVENDVAGIDINMGCPKSFSIKGGMGAALLRKPELIEMIIRSLKSQLNIPISCKIRVLDNLDSTLNLVKIIEKAGANAIAIHGRTVDERPRHPNRNDYIRYVADIVQIPVIANGDSCNIQNNDDLRIFKEKTNSSSVMISRAAIKNCSIFNQSLKDIDDVCKEYLKFAIRYDNTVGNTKYCLLQMLGNRQEVPPGKFIAAACDMKTISNVYHLNDYYDDICNERIKQILVIDKNVESNQNNHNKNVIELPIIFRKNLFKNHDLLPKTILTKWLRKNNINENHLPRYKTQKIKKKFHSIIEFDGKSYMTPMLETTKKLAEQSATLVMIIDLGILNDRKLIDNCMINNINNNSISIIKYYHQGRTYFIRR